MEIPMKTYPIIDWHCDVLMKLHQNPEYSFYDNENLDVNVLKLRKGGVKVQACAIFIDPDAYIDNKYDVALGQIDAFKNNVLKQEGIVHIKHFAEIENLKDDEIGVFLTLEGLDCVGSDITKVKQFIDEGVLSIGMTWNDANLACDGIGETRGAGLTTFGFDVVKLANDRDVFIDVSHISLNGFEDVLDTAKHVIASHSNVQKLASHRRNLNDGQIQRMKDKGALVHFVYCDAFVNDQHRVEPTTIQMLVDHIEHLHHAGLASQLGLGSDFDGISSKIVNLEDASQSQNLLHEISVRLGSAFAEDIAFGNFMKYINRHF